MKKRLISILLVAVMLLAMIPVISVASSAASVASYRSIVTTDYIEVDGDLDDAYRNSEKITSTYFGKGDSSILSFEAYTAVTTRGLYIWAEIKDSTLDKPESERAGIGDKFQIYVRFFNGTDNSWGYYDTDYLGRKYKTTKGGTLAEATGATMMLADGSGWRSETFIPFEGAIDFIDIKNLTISIGLQACNGNGGDTYKAICYDKQATSPYYYSAYDLYSPLDLFVYDDVLSWGQYDKTAVYVTSNIKDEDIDGIKDSFYSEHAKIKIKTTYTASGYENDTRADLGDLYFAFDDNYIYAYFETYDKDITTADECQFYYDFDADTANRKSGYFRTHISTSASAFFGNTSQTSGGFPGSDYESSDVLIGRKDLGNNLYGVEFRIPIPAAEKAKLAESDDASISVKLAFSASDYATADSRRCYGGCRADSINMWSYSNTANGTVFPRLVLSKEITDATPGTINSASLTLGSDITVNYYATVGAGDIDNAYMRFTKNGKTSIAYPEKTSTAGEYKFRCVKIAPQTIGDNIKAELIIDGEVVATQDSYSALQYCLNTYNNAQYSATKYNNMKMLIKALLNYGAAAQTYKDYKTSSLVDAEHDIELSTPTESNSIKSVGTPISDSIKFTALGVRYDNINRIYAKFTATSLSGVSVLINGEPVVITPVEGEPNTYIVYSEGIPVTRFASEYRITLTNGSKSQTAIYSVNSYAYAKLTSENEAMVELAKATYTYGEMAKKYVNHDTVSYKVMTFNDAGTAWSKVKEVSAIINDYKPDLVGLQEVAKSHTQIYIPYANELTYKKELPDYTIVYFDKDDDNLDVPALCYLTEKFEFLGSGRKMLSDTPDTLGSKYDDSAYIRCVIWVKLRDKTTGEEFVFANTHIDYNSSATVKQINKLLELMVPIAGDLPIIFTADWNMYRDSAGAKVMNAAGYYTTESATSNKYKPGTMIGSNNAIDFCFVDPDEFKTLDYKVINDHKYSPTASDHYAVYSEIVPVKIYEQAEIEQPEEPEIVYSPEGFFDGPDDVFEY